MSGRYGGGENKGEKVECLHLKSEITNATKYVDIRKDSSNSVSIKLFVLYMINNAFDRILSKQINKPISFRSNGHI